MCKSVFLNLEIQGKTLQKTHWLYYATSLHFHHLLSGKVGIIYSQVLRYNMIISEGHIFQEDLNNVTRILLARAYPLHLIIKKIKKALIYTCSNLLSQRTAHTETNLLSIITPFSDIGKPFIGTIHKNWDTIAYDATLSTIWPFKFLSVYLWRSTHHLTTARHTNALIPIMEL